MRKFNSGSHSIFRSIFAAMALLFAAAAVVQPAAAQVVLNQTSVQMPSLGVFNGRLYMAWAGTDSNHSLNVAFSTDGSQFNPPVVFGSNSAASNTGPAITPAPFLNRMYLAWVGGGNNLNIAYSTDGVDYGNQSLVGYTSGCSPALTTTGTILYMAYCNSGLLQIISSTDGVNWSTPTTPPFDATSKTPALIIVNGNLVVAYYDPVQNDVFLVSAAATDSLPTSGSSSWVLVDTISLATTTTGPAMTLFDGTLYLGIFGSPTAGGATDQGWLYTLEVLGNGGFQVTNTQNLGSSVLSTTNPAMASFINQVWIAWKGTNSGGNLNILDVPE